MNVQLRIQAKAQAKSSFTPAPSKLLQRKCACGHDTFAGGECAECQKKRLQRRAATQAESTEVLPIVHEVLRALGHPLDIKTCAFMEPRFGHDFSHVRVHTDAKAAQSARAVNALAYTVGRDVVFGAAQYVPTTTEGQRLIAHDLTHTLQQTNLTKGSLSRLSVNTQRNDKSEQEADQISENIFGEDTHGKGLEGTKGVGRTRVSSVLLSSLMAANHGLIQRKCSEHNNKAFYETAPNYCKDDPFTGQLHPGHTCFREVPRRSSYFDCPPGDQVCFDSQGKCYPSWDKASPVDSKKANGTCKLHPRCALEHAIKDKVLHFWWQQKVGNQEMQLPAEGEQREVGIF